MKNLIICILLLSFGCLLAPAQTEKPLRVFIRAGVKTHGPGQHDHPRFLKEWTELLNQRGAKAEGALNFPTAEQLEATDVLVLYAQEGADISTEQRASLDKFLKRGGGIVVLHDAVCGKDAPWFKTVVGGAWDYSHAKYFEGNISLYYQDYKTPITKGVSNFDFEDEMYYNLDMMPEAHVLAATYQPDDRNRHDGKIYPSVYEIVPQIWTYEKDNYRAFVSIPGHNYKSFELPHFRAVLLRGIAWAGKRDADLLVSKEELASLRYPEGGPTAPEKAAAKVVVPPDFKVNLVAAEPLIVKPISMDWDAKGRLWVAETPEYPYRQDRSATPHDRISILEDANGDGVMDKKTVFYEGLDLVTSMVFYKDGVIVSQAPDIYWLRDTKGTGKADTKVVLFTGFGTRDTHAVLSNMRWGFDGWVYATVGYSRGDIYSGDGKKHFGTVSEGVFRFKPDGSALEQVASKGGNTWGMDVAPDGELFFSQANGNHVNHVVMPETVLAKARIDNAVSGLNIEDHKRSYPLMSWTKQAYVQIDWVGNFTAASGCCIYDGGAWPDKYDYTHYVTEPTLNIVHQDVLKPQGVTYVASKDHDLEEKEFVSSQDLWFRPIHERVGPDGAMYILDFYNQAVVHNDTRGPRHDPHSNAAIRPDRDHYFGRVWRVQHQQAKQFNIPRLDGAKPEELVKALEHPNEWVRATAHRLLDERGKTDVAPALQKLAKSSNASTSSRIHALWVLNNLGAGDKALLVYSLNSNDPGVRKNATQIAALSTKGSKDAKVEEALLQRVKDSNGRVRLESIIALGNFSNDEKVVKALIGVYPDLNDKWLESAVAAVASENPEAFIAAASDAEKPQEYASLITQLANEIVAKQDAKSAAHLLEVVAGKPAAADSLKAIVLNALVKGLRPENAPEWNSQLQKAFQELLASSNTTLSTVSLPLMARWDKKGALAGDVKGLVQRLVADLNDATKSDDDRAQIAVSLLGVRQMNAEIVPSIAKIPGSSSSTDLQRRIIEALGALPDADMGSALVAAYPKVNAELQNALVNQLLKRADWSSALVDAIKAGQVNLATLGPVNINRLRTHSDRAVAEKANKVIDELRGPEAKEKNELIAKFTPLVTQPGDATRGHQLFLQNCATCHRLNGEGKDLAPDLTGMGAHGPAELIIHVLDPNRVVEPNFYSYSIETKDGEIYDGIITRENSASVMLRNAAGDTEIKTADIKSRRNTGLSLMPNGFESLGGDNLRDILAYVCAGDANFHLVDLQSAFTASTLNGLFSNIDSKNETLAFKRFGITKVSSIPFDVVNSIKSTSGKNVIVLKGGYGYSKTMPQKVVVEGAGLKANRLHFLGGVGGWAYPWGGDRHLENMPVAKVTVQFADNQSEEFVLKNGLEFADYIGAYDVPGSKAVPGMLSHGQVRWFTKRLKHQDAIKSITLESFDNEVAPVFVAITADSGTGNDAEVETVAAPVKVEPLTWDEGKHLLIVGGGSSHDFNRWFKDADSVTLAEKGKVAVNYLDKVDAVEPSLKDVDVLYLSTNQQMTDPALKKGIFDCADSGRGMLLVHPALWYNWKDWPEYNRVLVGGGATSHDKYGEFEVTVTNPGHPVMAGVPKTFRITDELYHAKIDPAGTPIEVLATGKNLATGETYPLVWVVKHPKARIVCCTLGHDSKAHDLDAYKAILRNSAAWVSSKEVAAKK